MRERDQPNADASGRKIVRETRRVLSARGRVLNGWLRQTALPAHDAYRADPSLGLSLEDVRASIRKV